MFLLVTLVSYLCFANAEPITIEDAPYIVSISEPSREDSFKCSGSIISANYVLTSAHCRGDFNLPGLEVRSGSNSPSSGGQTHRVVEFIMHEGFDQFSFGISDNDIALVKVEPPFDFDDKTTFTIQLFGQEDEIEAGEEAILSGWKANANDESADELEELYVTIVDNEICNNPEGKIFNRDIGSDQVCTEKIGNVLRGVLGSPLVVNDTLVGFVTSAPTDRFSAYTKVAYYRDWINQKVGVEMFASSEINLEPEIESLEINRVPKIDSSEINRVPKIDSHKESIPRNGFFFKFLEESEESRQKSTYRRSMAAYIFDTRH